MMMFASSSINKPTCSKTLMIVDANITPVSSLGEIASKKDADGDSWFWCWCWSPAGADDGDDDDADDDDNTTSFSSVIKMVCALPTVQVVPGVVLLAEKIEDIK